MGRPRSGVAVRVAGCIAALEPDLVHTAAAEYVAFEEEPLVEADAAALANVELRHPRADAIWVELIVPRAIQRVGEVDAVAVPADFDHLRAAGQRLVRPGRVRLAGHHAADPRGAGLDPGERGADGLLLHLPGGPAGHGQ